MINDCINIKDTITGINKKIYITNGLIKNIKCLSKNDKWIIGMHLISLYLFNDIKHLEKNNIHYKIEFEKKLSLLVINSVFNHNYYMMYALTEQSQLVTDIAEIYKILIRFFSSYNIDQQQKTIIICKQLTSKLLVLYDNIYDDIFNYTLFKDHINMLSYKIIKILDLQQDDQSFNKNRIKEIIVDRFI